MKLSIQTDFPQVKQRLERLRADVADKALAMAINRTMDQARTAMVRQITRAYNIKAGFVRQRLAISRVSFKSGSMAFTASLTGTGKRSANMLAFVAREAPNNGRRGGPQLGFRIRRGGPITRVTSAFIGNKGRTVFARTGDARLPIRALRTIDVPQMFNQREINAAVVQVIHDRFQAVFEQQVRFYASRAR